MDKRFSIGGIMTLVILLVITVYMVAYTIPTPAGVISNSTGKWGAMTASPGVFQLAGIVVPLIAMVAIIMFLVRKATD